MTEEDISFEKFKFLTKGYSKILSRLLCFEKYEIFGLVEWVINCPYSVVDVKCLSNDAVVYKISKEDFLNLIRGHKSLTQIITQKLNFMDERVEHAIDQYVLRKLAFRFIIKMNNEAIVKEDKTEEVS